MAQVVIVSNRLPVSVSKKNSKIVYSSSIGGLATGLSSYVNNPGNIWIGWPGIASEDLTESEKKIVIKKLAAYNCYPVFLNKQQIDYFYNGYSNSVLWPLFHSMPINKTNPGQLKQWQSAYKAVNQLFADAISGTMLKNSQVWVHDYQLLLLPQLLRTKQPKSSIGFFLHIPFPDIEVFANFIPAKNLIKGVLGADLIGFHTPGYVHNFLAYCKKARVGNIAGNRIYLESHTVRVGEFPMGIDYGKYASANNSKKVKQAIKRYKEKHPGLKYIVSIDRLDPTKGLVERLNAYESLLRRNPRYRGKLVFIMVAAPSRTEVASYRNLAIKLDKLANNINLIYGSNAWQPVDYINTTQPLEEVAALFQIADVAFIVPVRDGMNLTAKEFVASNNKHGVLILSETAGAAEELQDALIVSPEQPETLVGALEQALAMRKRELRFRLRRMKKQVAVNTVHHWAKSFIDTLQQPQYPNYPFVKMLDVRVTQNLYSDFGRAKKRLLLLDYDGTLVPYVNHYNNAKPSKDLIKILKSLASLPATDVVLISGRTSANLTSWFRGIKISLVAEHGLAIKRSNEKNWRNIEEVNSQWKELLQPILERYAKLAPGAQVEVKPGSLAWHYREAKPYQAQKYSVILKKSLKPILETYGLEMLQGSKVLEIKDLQISKGNAVREWLRDEYSFILAIGDDNTDETMFRALPAHSYSIRVGGGRTSAKLRVVSDDQVLGLLRGLASVK